MKLRSHLILLVVAALVPVLVFCGGLLVVIGQEQQRVVEVGLRGTTRALSAAVNERIASVIVGLQVLSVAEEFEPWALDRLHGHATRILDREQGWHAIALVRPDGTHLMNTAAPYGSPLPNLEDREFLRELVRTRAPVVSDLLFAKTTGEPIVAVAVPVWRDGEIVAALVGIILTSTLTDLLVAQEVPPDWTTAILDTKGTILARSRSAETFVGRPATPRLLSESRSQREGNFRDVTQEGELAYGAFRKSRVTGWTIVLGAPAHAVDGLAMRGFWRVLAGGAFLLILAAAFAMAAGRRIARPILALSSSAAALGQRREPGKVRSQVAEVETVSHALATAASELNRSEMTLREANETFDALIASSPIAIIVLDDQGVVRVWNPAAERILGWARSDVLGHPLRDIPQPEFEPFQGRLLATFSGEGAAAEDWQHTNREGELQILKVSTAPLRSADGAPRLVTALIEDVTENRRAQQRLTEERQTVDRLYQIGSALSGELNLQRVIQRLTDEATSLTGAQFGAYFRTDDGVPESTLRLYTLSGAPYEAFEGFGAPRSTAIFGPTLRGEAIIRLDDVTRDSRYGKNPPHKGMPEGHLPVRSYLAVPVNSRTGETLGGLFFGHSKPGVFTERHEQWMAAVAAQAAVAIDNARLYDQAKRAIQLRDDFLSVSSHELKTPLTSLELHVQLLRRKLSALAPTDRAPLEVSASRISQQVRRMADLVEQLLDVTRLASGRVELALAEFDLVGLLRQVLGHFEAESERAASELILHAEGEERGTWDRARLEQVFTNLVGNAIKYGEHSPIHVRITGEQEWVTVEVSDSGMGIRAEDQQRIFERFERAVSGRNYSGIGLGLWITRRILDQLGGEISVTSEPGAGATFSVRLPRYPQAMDVPTAE